MEPKGRNIEANHQTSEGFTTVFKLKNLNQTRKVRFDTQIDFSHSETEPKNHEELIGQSTTERASPQLLSGLRCNDKGLFWPFLQFSEKVHGSRGSTNFESENGMIFQRQFQKIEMKQISTLSIMRAKPLSNYCQVCKETFNDYLQHIEHHSHKKKEGVFTKSAKMIHDLVQDFEWSVKRSRSEKNISDQEDDQDEAIEKASKIRVYFIPLFRGHYADRLTTMRINNSKIAPSEVLTGIISHLTPQIANLTTFSTNKLLQN